MEATHSAVGLDSIGAIRVDLEWTPEKEGVQLTVRDPETLMEYGTWEAPRLRFSRGTPDDSALNAAVRLILRDLPALFLWARTAHGMARKGQLTWVPEKLAGC